MSDLMVILRYHARPILYAILAVCAGTVLVMFLYSIISTRQLVGEVRKGQLDRNSTFTLLQDCVTPKGECFKDANSRQGAVINKLQMSNIAAIACADQYGTQSDAEITACTKRSLIKAGVIREPKK